MKGLNKNCNGLEYVETSHANKVKQVAKGEMWQTNSPGGTGNSGPPQGIAPNIGTIKWTQRKQN